MVNGATKLIFIFGDPIAHSFSPALHNQALQKLDKNILYLPLQVGRENLKSTVEILRLNNVVGANITIPHKQAVIEYLDGISDEAECIGAVNTVRNKNGKLWGTTTDPLGFINSLKESGFNPDNKNIVILGSGGSARTIAFALALKSKPGWIHLAARAPEKLSGLVRDLEKKTDISVTAGHNSSENISSYIKSADLLVNCTSAGMKPQENAIPIQPDSLHDCLTVYDLVYNPRETLLLKEAKKRGGQVITGDGMLYHQGKASLEIWLDQAISGDFFDKSVLLN